MPDVKEVYEMVTKQKPPRPGALERQWDRQRRSARNRKMGVIALVAAIFIGLGVLAIARAPKNNTHPITSDTPSAELVPPFGAQIIDLHGDTVQEIPGVPEDSHSLQMSPDGRTIALRTWDGDGYQVATMGIDGTGLRILTHLGYPDPGEYPAGQDDGGTPAWSPDGKQIAYSEQGDIYVMDADGSNSRRITPTPGADYAPVWSPDGRTLAYYRDDGAGDLEIYTIAVDGGSPNRLTNNTVEDAGPDWSVDGWILFHRGGDNVRDGTWMMRPDGSHARWLFDGSDGKWSPDGTKVSFQTLRFFRDGSWEQGDVAGCPDCALLRMHIFDMATGTISNIGVRYAGSRNTAMWVSDDELLVNRYD